MVKYIKKAFFFHWNLLALATGIAVGIISGYPDVVFPALLALEVLYLAFLSTSKRFQDAVDAELMKIEEEIQLSSNQKLYRILETLNNEDRRRYQRLKNLCLELRRIANKVKSGAEAELEVISDVQVNNINRLLWMYLKLLYFKNALESFFAAINEEDIKARIDRTKKRLEAMGPESQDTQSETLRRRSLLDTLATSRRRLENYRVSMDNYDFIGLELERLHSKISSLAEMGINRRDPNLINTEIDVVTSSIEQTERAMSELDFLDGLSTQDEEPPSLLNERERVVEMRRR
jgi:hypothetical protein